MTDNLKNFSGVKEIERLRFADILAGPLIACVHGQVASAMATTAFVSQVGFKSAANPNGNRVADMIDEPVMLDFKYYRTTAFGLPEAQKLSVPLLTLLPIPNLRIQECALEFNVKITSMYKQKNSFTSSGTKTNFQLGSGNETTGEGTKTNADGSKGDDSYQWIGMMNTSLVSQSSTVQGYEVKREYSLSIKVNAVQDELPAGMEKLIAIMETQIREKSDAPGATALLNQTKV
mmetsp:Transcript_34160/g.85730  ORF Transcript_34160/g.85730 Transcript_34160/m.85730 type:complete len:233 (+) Transcript_34160:99-797(+)|eukprot:CAMPEP_0177656944 /NCGR_PEP_ID=MMETSP0447-20121125/15886_1 /TAXON_ID=0 /ORGANISM="Stygamoeba regulata, Strain BSH-02190019" /LENGTH=232 /DNA_ID=CAMNT_0019161195 /DNA_START=87 /DNA_END=785 /DNA_ORIENTATION=+